MSVTPCLFSIGIYLIEVANNIHSGKLEEIIRNESNNTKNKIYK